MSLRPRSWTSLLREHGPTFLKAVADERILERRLKVMASALQALVDYNIRSIEDVCNVWGAYPAVTGRCNDQATYEMPGAAVAYAWLHLLDRYARTWSALERMTEAACLPLGRFGVRALDIGTGPGPSSFAINDFYEALTTFARETGLEALQQAPQVTCVESDRSTNSFRHHLAEIAFEQTGCVSAGLLDMCRSSGDFRRITPSADRVEMQRRLRWLEDEYFGEARGWWTSDLVHTPEEANAIAQSMHRYRLFAFSNFLTTIGFVKEIEPNLKGLFADARPGSAILLLGGRRGPYPEVYEYVNRLACDAGFQFVTSDEVSSAKAGVAELVSIEENRMYDWFEQIAPDCRVSAEIREIKEGYRRAAKAKTKPVSQIWAYRKYKYHKPSS